MECLDDAAAGGRRGQDGATRRGRHPSGGRRVYDVCSVAIIAADRSRQSVMYAISEFSRP